MIYTLNTNTLGISQYTGPDWIGVAEIDGKTLLLRADGLDEQTGTTDNGEDIDAYIQTGELHFDEEERRKFCTEARVNGQFNEDLALTVYSNEHGVTQSNSYTLLATTSTENMGRYTKLGKGVRAMGWSFKLANTNGGTFKINAFHVAPRVGLMSR